MGPDKEKTILIVDKDKLITRSIQESLSSQGYKVVLNYSGEEAVKTIESDNPIDLVLMEIDLGKGIRGIQAAKNILNLKTIPILFLTCNPSREISESIKEIKHFGLYLKTSGEIILQSAVETAFRLFECRIKARETEDLFYAFMDNIPNMVIIKDEHLRPVYFNRKFQDTFPAKDWFGKTPGEIFLPDAAARMEKADLYALKEGYVAYEETWDDKYGNHKILETRKFIINRNGLTPHLGVFITDITERKKVEIELSRSNEKYKLLLDQAPIGIGLATLDGRVLSANKMMERITGYNLNELKSIRLTDFYLNVKEREVLIEILKKDRIVSDYPVTLKRKDGTQYYASLTIGTIIYEGEEVLQTIIQDISDRIKMENSIRESEERYRDLFENSILALFRSTLEGKVIIVNQAFADLFSYESPEEVYKLVKNISADLFAEPGRREEIVRMKSENPDLVTFENQYRRKDGSTFIGKLSLKQITDPNSGVQFE